MSQNVPTFLLQTQKHVLFLRKKEYIHAFREDNKYVNSQPEKISDDEQIAQ